VGKRVKELRGCGFGWKDRAGDLRQGKNLSLDETCRRKERSQR